MKVETAACESEDGFSRRPAMGAVLKRNGVMVTKRKVDIAIALRMYQSGRTTGIAEFFDTNGAAVKNTPRNGMKKRKNWEYPHSERI